MVKQQPSAELLAGYVLGDLTPEEITLVEQRLARDPQWQAELIALQETLACFPLSLPESCPHPDLGSQILQQAKSHKRTLTLPLLSSLRARVSPVFPLQLTTVGIVTFLLIAGLGITSVYFRREAVLAQRQLARYEDVITSLRDPSNRLLTLVSIEPTNTASGTLLVIPDAETTILTLENLPPLPPGQVYRLWAIADGNKVDCFDFSPDPTGKVFKHAPLDQFLAQASTVLVTVEPQQNLSEPTGDVVLEGNVAL
jgi:anti-sigma-K factor RskA